MEWTRTAARDGAAALATIVEPPVVGTALPFDGLSLDGVDVTLDPSADELRTARTGVTAARLVRELREERQWVLDIASSFSLQRDCSLFTLQAWLEPDKVDAVEALICDRLSALATRQVTRAELELQRSEPVITVVEEPVPPMERSAPNRPLQDYTAITASWPLPLIAILIQPAFKPTPRPLCLHWRSNFCPPMPMPLRFCYQSVDLMTTNRPVLRHLNGGVGNSLILLRYSLRNFVGL